MDYSALYIWDGIIHLSILAVLLLFANVIRRKVPWMRRSLLPTAVIAGFIGLLFKETLYERFVSPEQYESSVRFLRTVIYHTIALGFIALGLKVNHALKVEGAKKRGIFSGLLIVTTYMLQGLAGLSITIFLSFTFFPDLFKASGMLLPMGLGQGPGQAQNIGNLYESTHGFVGGTSFGLAIASFGFLWASVVGIMHLQRLYKSGIVTKQAAHQSKHVSAQEIETPDEIPLSEAIDKFTIQVSLVLMVYFVTFLFIHLSGRLLDTGVVGDFGINTIKPLIYGFNFIIAMLLALVFKQIFLWLRKTKIMTRQYPNNYMLNRIAGFVFDLMIVAAISAIRIEDLRNLWIPFLILVFSVGSLTIYFILKMTKRIFPDYPHEAALGMFGMLSGTASTGVVLLREIDPEFKTPAINDLVIGSSTAIMFGFPILLLVGIAPAGTMQTYVTFGIIMVLFIIALSVILRFNPKLDKQ